MLITLKLRKSVNTVPELSRAIEAFQIVDEVYRLMKSSEFIEPEARIDFRKKPLRDASGGSLEGFRVSSPPEISVGADSVWLAAILYVLNNYSTIKGNVRAISSDTQTVVEALQSIGEHELQKAQIGARMFAEQLEGVGEVNRKWLEKKLETARRIIYPENIAEVTVDDESGT